MNEDELKALARLFKDGDLGTAPEASPPDLGWLGRVFGGRYANTNIAGLVATASFILIFVAVFWPHDMEYRREVIAATFSVITLILGYLFGSTRSRQTPVKRRYLGFKRR